MKKLLTILILILLPLSVFAETVDFTLTCDKTEKINVGEEIICRVATKHNFLYDRINFDIVNMEGLEIVDVRSNYDKIWQVNKNDNKITASSTSTQTGLQEFGILLIKAVKDGHQNLALDNITLENTETEEVKEIDSIVQTLKVVSSDNFLKNIKINDKELDDFDSQKTNYDIHINDESSIKIEAESNNEFASVKGIGEFKLSDKVSNFVFPITVLSEDGVSKIYILNIIRDNFEKNSIDKTLESLIIKNDKGNTLLINFNPTIYNYSFDVNLNTKSLDFKPVLNNKKTSFVKGYGDKKLTLYSGNNIVIIKVQDESGDILNYVLNITKPIANKSSNNYIKSLLIKNYKINFSKRIKNYTLEVNPNDDYLEITPILESNTARYTITGNSDLKDGSVIKIEVTAENEEKTIYKINIKSKKTNYFNYLLYILGIGLVLYIIYRLSISIKKFITRKRVMRKVATKKKETSVKNKPVKVTKTVTNPKSKKTGPKVASKKSSNKNTTNNKKSNNKKSTNSTSTRNPRSNYTKKSPTKRKKTGKKNTTNKKKK